ncbi:hypothetical protein M3Y95_00975600 [Aphelenchoides besseyi]|nr:hypothetical protein M3Y95_00975600 [Aphelenchoides besseyi]
MNRFTDSNDRSRHVHFTSSNIESNRQSANNRRVYFGHQLNTTRNDFRAQTTFAQSAPHSRSFRTSNSIPPSTRTHPMVLRSHDVGNYRSEPRDRRRFFPSLPPAIPRLRKRKKPNRTNYRRNVSRRSKDHLDVYNPQNHESDESVLELPTSLLPSTISQLELDVVVDGQNQKLLIPLQLNFTQIEIISVQLLQADGTIRSSLSH